MGTRFGFADLQVLFEIAVKQQFQDKIVLRHLTKCTKRSRFLQKK